MKFGFALVFFYVQVMLWKINLLSIDMSRKKGLFQLALGFKNLKVNLERTTFFLWWVAFIQLCVIPWITVLFMCLVLGGITNNRQN